MIITINFFQNHYFINLRTITVYLECVANLDPLILGCVKAKVLWTMCQFAATEGRSGCL